MILVYVAGKFRGPNAWEIERNIRRAEELGYEVAKLGAMPVIPHANTRFFHGAIDDAFFLKGTLEMLRRCDAVVLVDNWLKSAGARAEVEEAKRLGIPVCETLPQLAWLISQRVAHAALVRRRA